MTAQFRILLSDCPQKNANQQRKCHRIRSVIYAGRIVSGGIEDNHFCCGSNSKQQKEKAYIFALESLTAFLIEQKQNRPQQIELDFNRQKPKMGKRGGAGQLGKIGRLLLDLPPVVITQKNAANFLTNPD